MSDVGVQGQADVLVPTRSSALPPVPIRPPGLVLDTISDTRKDLTTLRDYVDEAASALAPPAPCAIRKWCARPRVRRDSLRSRSTRNATDDVALYVTSRFRYATRAQRGAPEFLFFFFFGKSHKQTG